MDASSLDFGVCNQDIPPSNSELSVSTPDHTCTQSWALKSYSALSLVWVWRGGMKIYTGATYGSNFMYESGPSIRIETRLGESEGNITIPVSARARVPPSPNLFLSSLCGLCTHSTDVLVTRPSIRLEARARQPSQASANANANGTADVNMYTCACPAA
ncbi:hypothetical protein FIBSPDRAFT_331720 [Athelia psychrophila]|uniref:Uncharacterized protein n=1 Tax=Athelia psychrophila TaxID=1759441 RepID=A0A167WF65_9AGAM|nr:hypothetical protein FIBSPDRAFT_331720 [Fibularhizoctonia sp. CBS 109695]